MKSRDLKRIVLDFRNVDKNGLIPKGASMTAEETQAAQYPALYAARHGTTTARYYLREEVYNEISNPNSPHFGIFKYLQAQGWTPARLPAYNIETLLAGMTR